MIIILLILIPGITGCGHKSAKTESSTVIFEESCASPEEKTSEDAFSEKQEESCSSENESSSGESVSSETTQTTESSNTSQMISETSPVTTYSDETHPVSNASQSQNGTTPYSNTENTEKRTTNHPPLIPSTTSKPAATAPTTTPDTTPTRSTTRPARPVIPETTTFSAPMPSAPSTTNQNSILVTMSISCNVVLDNPDLNPNVTVPSDGIVLNSVTINIKEGDTVYDAFQKACQNAGIVYEFNGTVSRKSIYISSIAGLSQMNCGPYSGWKYSVNGIEPSVGCSMYSLSDGDIIDWHYTTTL